MKPWKTLSRELILNFSRFLSVERHTVELPNGRVIDDWPWVILPDYVNVVPILPDGRVACFRQVKYAAAGGISLAPVGGMIDAGEAPLDAAHRELREEMGLAAGQMIPLGVYATDANRGCGVAYPYLALNAQPVGFSTSDDLEEQEIIYLTLPELRQALLAGEFKILSWSASVALALAYLSK